MRIAIIGAGWAGLSAAIKLHQQGYHTTIFEAARQPGGRARSIQSRQLGVRTDNGQHILIGAYHACFELMRSLDIDPQQVLLKQTLNITAADNSLKFRFLKLPAPFNQLGIFLNSHGLNGIKGRIFFIRLAKELRTGKTIYDSNVYNWFKRLNCPDTMLERLWAPLCIATCNTSIKVTNANIFATVLRDSLLKQASDSDIYIPINLLDDLWLNQAVNKLANNIQYKHITEIKPLTSNQWQIADQIFNKIIIATPYTNARKLIKQLPHADKYLNNWPQMKFSAIGTLNLELAQPWQYPHAMRLLFDNPENHAWGQWLFNRNAIPAAKNPNIVHIVIGQAQNYANIANETISQGIITQIQQQTGTQLPKILNQALITEKRATFDTVNGLIRPSTTTPWPGLLLAGDWTDTGYPAVLEGAVRSGIKAANFLIN